MTLLPCEICGRRLHKKYLVVSSQTGRAWCVDKETCEQHADTASDLDGEWTEELRVGERTVA